MLLRTAFQKYNFHGGGKIWYYKWQGKKWVEDDLVPVDGKRGVKYGQGVWLEWKKLN